MSGDFPNTMSCITLYFSACKRFNSLKIHTENTVCPFQATIEPTNDIEWEDLLTAFISFYHQANYKIIPLPSSSNSIIFFKLKPSCLARLTNCSRSTIQAHKFDNHQKVLPVN